MKEYPTWIKRINDAKKIGAFDSFDVCDSECWDRCAIGEKFKAENPSLNFERIYVDEEITNEAYSLGESFTHAVHRQQISEAEKIYKEIQSIQVTA